ncbi:MAG: HEAT repeat domain-containing protein [Candidatus Wallbacteria bacterium]|nr:HEAT repeat domain-containing protein [Candidatus Wallbacteria bacterium]
MPTDMKTKLFDSDVEVRRKAFCGMIVSGDVPEGEKILLFKKMVDLETDPDLRPAARKQLEILVRSQSAAPAGHADENTLIPLKKGRPVSPKNPLTSGTTREKLEYLKAYLTGRKQIQGQDLLKHISEEQDVFVLATLVSCIGRLGSPENCGAVAPLLQHWNPRVRANAVEVLKTLGSTDWSREVALLLDDEDSRVRANAAVYFLSMDPDLTVKILAGMVKSGRRTQIESAYHVLREMEDDRFLSLKLLAERELQHMG